MLISKTTHIEEILNAAEALNKANVRDASNAGTKRGLYRDNMSPEARVLDEAFQRYYEAQQPRTLPPISSGRVEIDAKTIGFTLKDDTPPEPPRLPSGKTYYFD